MWFQKMIPQFRQLARWTTRNVELLFWIGTFIIPQRGDEERQNDRRSHLDFQSCFHRFPCTIIIIIIATLDRPKTAKIHMHNQSRLCFPLSLSLFFSFLIRLSYLIIWFVGRPNKKKNSKFHGITNHISEWTVRKYSISERVLWVSTVSGVYGTEINICFSSSKWDGVDIGRHNYSMPL